jgi:tetratricopeptide (TPR) repeat protein
VLLVAAEAAQAGEQAQATQAEEQAQAAQAREQAQAAQAGEQAEIAQAATQTKAMEYARQALDVTGTEDPGRATVRILLGALDPAHATDHFRAAAEQAGASPRTRCDAAERWALAARAEGRLDEAGKAYLRAVELLPAVATRGLGRADRERQLEHRSTLAADAVATALELDDATTALRLLETGRAVLHSQQLDLRTDLTALRHRDPETADRLAGLAAVLDHDRLGH